MKKKERLLKKSRYRCISCRLVNILPADDTKRNIIKDTITDAVLRTNEISIRVMQYIKLFCIYLFDHNIEIPVLDKNFITTVMGVITSRSASGRKVTTNEDLFIRLNDFYETTYKPLLYEENKERVSSTRIGDCLDPPKGVTHIHWYHVMTENFEQDEIYVENLRTETLSSVPKIRGYSLPPPTYRQVFSPLLLDD
jgi:hypothetical protein